MQYRKPHLIRYALSAAIAAALTPAAVLAQDAAPAQKSSDATTLDAVVVSGSAAEQAGLRGTSQVGDGLVLGDIILAVNGRKVTDYDSLRDEVERYQVGETVALPLLRDDATAEVNVRLEALQ